MAMASAKYGEYDYEVPMACETIFLDEEARDDLLPAHQGVLDALKQITDRNGGRVIGLVGRFGSGKTTIVRQLEAASATATPRTKYVFVFDAWAHRGDALRKAIVTQLMRFFEREQLLDSHTRDAVHRAVTRQPDRAIAEAAPRAALSIAIVTAITVLSRLVRSEWDLTPPWILGLGFLLFIAAIFMGRTTATTVTVKASDLTTQEFQEAFAKATSAVLRAHEERRVVIVFDDLDRLTPEEADEVITVLRIFIDSRREIPEFKRLWYVVPYEKNALSDAVQKRGADVLEKLFAISIEVPPPNLPTGSDLFECRFLKAFPSHTSLEAQRIHSMLLQENPNRTLRHVTWFINRLGVLHMRWCARGIPIEDLAGYTLIADSIDETKIATLSRPHGTSDQWQTHAAALHFNVDPSNAQYVLRRKEIEAAIFEGSTEALWKLSTTPGFNQMVSKVLTEKADYIVSSPHVLIGVIRSFGMNNYADVIWDKLISAAKAIEIWPTATDLRPMAIIFGHAKAEERGLIRAVFRSLSNGLQLSDESQRDMFERWVENFITLRATHGPDALPEAYGAISGSPLFRLKVLDAIDDGRFEYGAAPPVTVSDTDPLFLLEFATNRLDSSTYGSIARFVALLGAFNWSTVLDAAEQKMHFASAVQTGHPAVGRIMQFLAMTARHAQQPEAVNRLDLYAQRGDFLQFAILTWHIDSDTPAVMLAVLTTCRPEVVGHVVKVVTFESKVQANADQVLSFLRDPQQNTGRLETIRSIHKRLGMVENSCDLLRRTARELDRNGGIELVEFSREPSSPA